MFRRNLRPKMPRESRSSTALRTGRSEHHTCSISSSGYPTSSKRQHFLFEKIEKHSQVLVFVYFEFGKNGVFSSCFCVWTSERIRIVVDHLSDE